MGLEATATMQCDEACEQDAMLLFAFCYAFLVLLLFLLLILSYFVAFFALQPSVLLLLLFSTVVGLAFFAFLLYCLMAFCAFRDLRLMFMLY